MERLRPIDIEKTTFETSFRGFERKAVQDFKVRCAKEVEALLTESQSLKADNERMRSEIESFRAQESTLTQALLLAQKAADDTKAVAHRESENIVEEARRRATDLQRELETKLNDVRWDLERARLDKQDFVARFRAMLEDHLRNLAETEPRLAVVEGTAVESVG